jgi:magnesium chelatase family protein
MLSIIYSGALVGVESVPVSIEFSTRGESERSFYLVGLPDAAVRESLDRVLSAIINSGLHIPKEATTISLAPGDLKKEGALYDLPIALGILSVAGHVLKDRLGDFLVAGELGLGGATRAVKGGVALALQARREKRRGVILPRKSAEEAALVEGVAVYPVDSLHEAVRFLNGAKTIEPARAADSPFRRPPNPDSAPDFSEVKGQKAVRRAVEVAVAGGHNLLMIGPPGSGKSMVARRIPTILPEPSLDEFLEILGIQSAAGISIADSENTRCFQRPFRAPHHTISDVGLIGGGSIPGPGEISLAHHGVLFLDELPEFKRSALEVLRQPLEDGNVTISRAAGKITLPSQFMLVTAMNPTPCGYVGARCRCTPQQIQRYRARVSGPLLDRIDIHIEAPELSIEELRTAEPGEPSATIRERVIAARDRQRARFTNAAGITQFCNARMTPKLIRVHCKLTMSQGLLLQRAMERLNLSARAYDRILKVARTISDLANSDEIKDNHLAEAIQYRNLDRYLSDEDLASVTPANTSDAAHSA